MKTKTQPDMMTTSLSGILSQLDLSVVDGCLRVLHPDLAESDLARVRPFNPALKRMAKCEYSRYGDGWWHDSDFQNRAFLVHSGHILDSVVFDRVTQAHDFLRRIHRGESPQIAAMAASNSIK